MKLILEYDDFCSHEPENCLEIMYEMIKEVPHIKFNMFTVPFMRGKCNTHNWIQEITNLIHTDNLRLCTHGLYHSYLEFEEISKKICEHYFDLIKDIQELYDKESWLKVFRGPNWGLNTITIEELIRRGYTHIYNHENHRQLETDYIDRIKFIYYNQNLKDKLEPRELMIVHGHTHNVCDNGIKETKYKLLRFIEKHNPEFIWANEI